LEGFNLRISHGLRKFLILRRRLFQADHSHPSFLDCAYLVGGKPAIRMAEIKSSPGQHRMTGHLQRRAK
jgi:hypothetical protein